MVVFVRNKQFRALEISRTHSHIIVLVGQIKLSKPPVDDAKFPSLMINHNVLRFNIPVHDAYWMAVMEPFQNLIQVIPAIKRGDHFQQFPIIGGPDVLKDQAVDITLFDNV